MEGPTSWNAADVDDDGNVKTSTLLVGVVVTLGLVAATVAVVEAFPRLVYVASVPPVVFLLVFVHVVRSRARRTRR